MNSNKMPQHFLPQQLTVTLPCSSQQIVNVASELTKKAQVDANHCWGYFPGMKGKQGIDADLHNSEDFAQMVSALEVASKDLSFNFVRLSLTQQKGSSPYHLDTDTATALTGDTKTISKRLVWRLLVNLSDSYPRTLSYLDIDSTKIELLDDGGYLHCDDKLVKESVVRRIVIPKRVGTTVNGVLFCASRVLHTGQDDKHGHFVAGFGCEEPDA